MRIGSIVLCRKDRHYEYCVTNCDGVYKVTGIVGDNIIIEVVSHKNIEQAIGHEYVVDPKNFYEKGVKFS